MAVATARQAFDIAKTPRVSFPQGRTRRGFLPSVDDKHTSWIVKAPKRERARLGQIVASAAAMTEGLAIVTGQLSSSWATVMSTLARTQVQSAKLAQSQREVTRDLFDAAWRAKGDIREQFYTALVEFADAQDVVDVAIEEYQEHGGDTRLSFACSIVGAQRGEKTLSVLRQLAAYGAPESAYFIGLARHSSGIADAELADVLGRFATSPSTEVREAVIDVLENREVEGRIEILQSLRSDPDCSVARQAEAALEDLENC